MNTIEEPITMEEPITISWKKDEEEFRKKYSANNFKEPEQKKPIEKKQPVSLTKPVETKDEFRKKYSAANFKEPQNQAEESSSKNLLRTALQIPKGRLQGTKYGIITGLMSLMGTGEALDPEEIEHIKMISEREGVPFDEEKYMQAVQGASEAFPTVENIARGIEHATGIPLEANTWLQKFVNFGSMATQAIKPGDWIKPSNYAGTGFRGTDVVLPYPVVGTGVAVAKEVLEAMGVPEQLAELGSFAVTKQLGKGSAALQVGKKRKPSGLIKRGFEDLKSTRKVSEAKMTKINEKLETDFKTISDQIIKESPIGETAKELANNSTYKEETRVLLNEAKSIAEATPEPFEIADLKKDLADTIAKNKKGLITSEYEDAYASHMKGYIKKLKGKENSALSLYEQYRKNNDSLGEYFAPGSSKSVNRAHKDALLDFNRSIARTMEKAYPDSPLVPVFKEGNARWSKIMDAEMVDKFVGELFKDGVDFQKMNKFLESKGYAQSFKRALGEDGYKAFRSIVNDMAFSKNAYNKMKVMKETSGLEKTAKTMFPYFLNFKAGLASTAKNLAMDSYKFLTNYMLDKPKFTIRWKKALDTLKEGKMSQAAKQFEALHGELLEAEAAPLKGKVGETIEVKPEVVKEAKGISHQPKEVEHVKKGEVLPIEKPSPSLKQDKIIEVSPESVKKFNESPVVEQLKLKGMKPPKLIEYKPGKVTPKERSAALARESFAKASEGHKIAPAERKNLAKTQVALMETRGKGQQYHGTSNLIKQLSDNIYSTSSPQNIYGPGFYTTDALDIADGYSKSKKKITSSPTVYQVYEKTPQNLYDAEKPFKEFKEWMIEDIKKTIKDKKGESIERYIENSNNPIYEIVFIEKEPKSVRDLFDRISEYAENESLRDYEAQELFTDVQDELMRRGYEGMSHTGGLLTNNPEHLVKIYWKPENLEIQEFSYPKSFKKAKKVAKPPELPATLTK